MSVLQPSFCDNTPRPPGVGFTPPPGARSHLYSLPNAQGVAGVHLMDLSAHGFGDTHTYSATAQRARYGPNFHGADANLPRFLALDFESLFGVGSIHLSKLACAGRFGSDIPTRLSCYPTLEELHDFYAVHPEEAEAAMGTGGAPTSSRQPGIPVIVATNTATAGEVHIQFRAARKGHNLYEVGVWDTMFDAAMGGLPPLLSIPVAGSAVIAPGSEELSVRVEIPSTLSPSHHFTLRVRAFLGGSAGRWSLARQVDVRPKPSTPSAPSVPSTPPVQPPVVPPPVVPPIEPPVTPPVTPPIAPPTTPPSDLLTRLRDAASSVRRVLPDPGKGGAPLQRLAGEVRKLLAVIDGAGE